MTSTPLNRRVVDRGLLTPVRRPRRTGIVHLGLGSFHRAHQAVYTARAAAEDEPTDWGILGVASRSSKIADALLAQDGLYTVLTVSPTGTTVHVPGIHTGALVAVRDPAAVVAAIADATTRIVSMTVTESGYSISPRTHRLAVANAEIAADLSGRPPSTTIGQIARGLELRARTHQSPVTVMSCDNLESNGDQTRSLVLEFLDAAAASDQVLQWVAREVAFPNSMVDRIVPATSDAYRAAAEELIGLRDQIPVPAEPFSMWVIEDTFAAGRPAWERAGATFSPHVAAYEAIKLRLLNGTHSLIAYLGALDGHATIPEARAQAFIEAAAHAVLAEYLPSIDLPPGFDLDAYIAKLFQRWANHPLGHRTQQVGSDGSVKLPQRIPEPALRLLRIGVMPEHLALTVAGWLCCLALPAGFDPGPHARAMTDPARSTLASLAAHAHGPRALVEAVFAEGGFFGEELVEHPDFLERVAEYITVITTGGVQVAASEAARAQSPIPH